eukprot:3208940-Rhodomonas_salina.2
MPVTIGSSVPSSDLAVQVPAHWHWHGTSAGDGKLEHVDAAVCMGHSLSSGCPGVRGPGHWQEHLTPLSACALNYRRFETLRSAAADRCDRAADLATYSGRLYMMCFTTTGQRYALRLEAGDPRHWLFNGSSSPAGVKGVV